MIDIHNHCKYSYDSKAEPKSMIELAIQKGAKIYGFSDHVDLKVGKSFEETVANTQACLSELHTYRRAYADTLILCGVEFDHRREAGEKYKKLVDMFDFDYVIQSVHEIGDRECYSGFFKGLTIDEGYHMYFDEVEDSLRVPFDFQILGHLGFLFKSAKNISSNEYFNRYQDRITKILKLIIQRGIALETNTSTYKSPVSCVPDENVLRLYYELGGRKITIGSDAHSEERVMDHITEVLSLLAKIGFKDIYYFENKRERRIPIGDLLELPLPSKAGSVASCATIL